MKKIDVPRFLLLFAIVGLLLALYTDQAYGQQVVIRDCPPHTVISGLAVEGERFGIIAINCPGIVIEDNHIVFHGGSGSGGGGIVLYESPDSVVRWNVVGSYGDHREGVGIRVHRSNESQVYHNRIDLRGETNERDGECIAINSGRVVVRDNTVRGCPGIGILLWGGVENNNHNNIVDSNVIIDPGYGLKAGKNWAYPGVVVISRDSMVTDAQVTNNLLVHTGDPRSRKARVATHARTGCINCTFSNNTQSQ